MRFALVIPLAVSLLPAQDLRQIIRHAVELDANNIKTQRLYSYQERREQHEFDGSGKPRREEVRTWDVIPLEGTSYRRLLARNDVPLSPAEQSAELDKLHWTAEQRRKETPQERRRRIDESDRRQRTHDPLSELPDAFQFTLAGEAVIDGRPAYVIDATPRKGYRPKSQAAAYFPKIKARLWIDKADGQWVKVEAETLDTISIGGFILRVAKGTRYTAEQMRITSSLWVPKRVWYKASARIALVKSIQLEVENRLGDYRQEPAPLPSSPAAALMPRGPSSR